jgi:hypothetical protein
VKDRLARWRALQENALALEQTETLPSLSKLKCSISNGARCGGTKQNKVAINALRAIHWGLMANGRQTVTYICQVYGFAV